MKVKRNFIGLILAIVVLVFSGVIGSVTGVFEGVEDISGMVNFNPETILKAGIVIGFCGP